MQKIFTTYFFILILSFTIQAQSKADYRQNFTEGDRLILEGNYTNALKAFLKAYQSDSTNANINYKIGYCYLKTPTEKQKSISYLELAIPGATSKYIDLDPSEKSAPFITYYYYAQALHLNYRFDEAIVNFEKFKSYFKNKQSDFIPEIDRSIEMCNYAKMLVPAPLNVEIKNMGDSINSAFSDHSPVIAADEKTILFTSRRPGGTGTDITIEGDFYEDIYVAYKKDNSWTTPKSISTNINTTTHEASIGLSADAQTLLIYKDINGGDIYYSNLDLNDWTFPLPMGSDINTPNYETSACLSPDGNTLYFVSDRKEGGLGGKDIWKCIKLPNGKWGLAQNLGAPINTKYDEESPFIHPSGSVLFFSSKGHQSIGGFDIFFSNFTENAWEEPLNIGYPINTTDDDLSYVTSPDGKRGYYASAAKADGLGEKDIYVISIPERKEQPLVLIKGLITPAQGQQLSENIEIIALNNETGIISGIYKPLARDGSFTIIIPPGSNYNLSYQIDGEEFYKETMNVPADAAYQEIEKEVKLKPVTFDGARVDVINKSSLDNKVPISDGMVQDTLYYQIYLKNNVSKINESDPKYIEFINNIKKNFSKTGKVTILSTSSASKITTKTYSSNKDLATSRANASKQQVLRSLLAAGIPENKINFEKVKSFVAGPDYDPKNKSIPKEEYEKHQYIKIIAY